MTEDRVEQKALESTGLFFFRQFFLTNMFKFKQKIVIKNVWNCFKPWLVFIMKNVYYYFLHKYLRKII